MHTPCLGSLDTQSPRNPLSDPCRGADGATAEAGPLSEPLSAPRAGAVRLEMLQGKHMLLATKNLLPLSHLPWWLQQAPTWVTTTGLHKISLPAPSDTFLSSCPKLALCSC